MASPANHKLRGVCAKNCLRKPILCGVIEIFEFSHNLSGSLGTVNIKVRIVKFVVWLFPILSTEWADSSKD